MLNRLPLFVWPFLFGMLFMAFVGAIAVGYLPFLSEFFGNVRTECSLIGTDKKEIYDCLLSGYTGQLAAFTQWLAIATIALALVTLILAALSVYQISSGIERDKIVESAYLVGGGGVSDETPPKFGLDLANYGKSPASMKAYAVEICDFSDLPEKPMYLDPNYKRQTFIDEIAPKQKKTIYAREVSSTFAKPIVYGRFWYQDIWRRDRYFSFILRVGTAPERGFHRVVTLPDLEGVDPEYSAWK